MKNLFTTKNLVLMAVFSALAAVLMILEFPIPFIAPSFYEIDLSEIPILIGSFIMGPVAGVVMEAIKILLKLLIKGTTTAYVGDFANFCIGCCLVLPASIIYRKLKTKKGALIGMGVGTLTMAAAGAILNYFIMIPFFVKAFGMPLDDIIAAGTSINPLINNKFTLVLICVAPFNILKGFIDSLVTFILYKRISTFIKSIGNKK
ncbi:ECF transporter S component [uncultured Eubacterium sp.]|uniref:ECF transporter S component n=1 Tax=uncultured Eubacterium sp. TaxID=165185 RepID=UPI0026733BDB|nr:ECF transporter S component [uncultured Eubacterium sp.]